MASSDAFDKPVDRQKFSLQYVVTPTSDTIGTTYVLNFEQKRYLFGSVGEGTQRACTERGISLKKARNFFLTGETRWASLGGLLGMLLTIADVSTGVAVEEKEGLGDISIYGGPKIWHTIACARRFIFRTGMPMHVMEANPNSWRPSKIPDFHDENILLWALPVRSRSVTQDTTSKNTGITNPDVVAEQQELRRRTVKNMFNSDWHRDRLHEATFAEVKLPAMVWIRDPVSKSLQATFCTKMSDAPHIAADQQVFVRLPWPAALVTELPSTENLPSNVAMSYLVKGRPQRGSFLPAKAKAAGVQPGPDYGLLANGKSITLDDGRVVTPEEVMSPIDPGQGVAILDVPSEQYLPDLAEKIRALRNGGVLRDVNAFSWSLGSGIASSQAFSAFIAEFSDVKHVVASPDHVSDNLTFDGSAASTARLNSIRPDTFILPRHNNDIKSVPLTDNGMIPAQRGLVLEIAPKFNTVTHAIPPNLDIPAVLATMSAETRSLIPTHSSSQGASSGPYDDITITTLGTGSALPSKYRNVSSNLLHIPSLGYFFFDAGEGTMGQLRRIFDPDQLDEVLCNTHMIWISHLHADHHLGTLSLMRARHVAIQKKRDAGHTVSNQLYMVSERNMADFLEEYRSIEQFDALMIHCLNSDLKDSQGQAVVLSDTTLPISKLETTRVSHCHGAQAISVTFSNGFKISYSGDCRPSAQFAEIGKDSDVLIHEATFDDGMEGDALAKKHSTIGEALGVGRAMRAKNIILTHFSQRYQKLPTLQDVKAIDQIQAEEELDEMGTFDATGAASVEAVGIDAIAGVNGEQNDCIAPKSPADPQIPKLTKQLSLEKAALETPICIAFDFLKVNIPQIRDMYQYYPAFESMFEYEEFKSEEKRRLAREDNEAMINSKTNSKAKRAKVFAATHGKKKRSDKEASGKGGATSHKGTEKTDICQQKNRTSPNKPVVTPGISFNETGSFTSSMTIDDAAASGLLKRSERSVSPMAMKDQTLKKARLDVDAP